MSFDSTNRSSLLVGAIPSHPNSVRRSGTSAHAKPPPSARESNSVTNVSIRTFGSTRAAIGTVQSVNPPRVIIGWPERQRNFCSGLLETRACSEHNSASWRCCTPGTNRFVRTLTHDAWHYHLLHFH